MLENYLVYLEICMQLYANQNHTQEMNECSEKYEELLYNEYNNLSSEEKEYLKQLISSKINATKVERSTLMLTLSVASKDEKLENVFPEHIKNQYRDKLKQYEKEMHFLQSINTQLNNLHGIKK